MGNISLIALIALLAVVNASALSLRKKSENEFTVKDKVYVNGEMFAEGSAISDNLGCQTFPKGASQFKVCGCGVKVMASLLSECKEYGKYTHQIGHCDCGRDDCDDQTLETGYTEKFSWMAYSFEIAPCK